MSNEKPQHEWNEDSRLYWGDELMQMSDAQVSKSEELEVPRECESEKAPISLETPEAVHQYILDELGDTELARRMAEHPEIMGRIVHGEGLPSPEYFSLIRAIEKENPNLAFTLAQVGFDSGGLLKLQYNRVVGNVGELEKKEYLTKASFLSSERAATVTIETEKKKALWRLR